jgi:2-oxoisovalerate dehydrogenase E1 component alpha subunit
MVAAPAQDDLRRVLDDEGRPLPGARTPAIADATLECIFDTMLLVRVIDERMSRLQREGRLGFYIKSLGEEGCHFAAAPLRHTDWIFPSYREQGAWFWRGYTIQQYVDQLLGNEGDPSKGRQIPVHHSAAWLNLVSISSPVGTQIPQAVGAAYAAKTLGKDDVAMVFFGEGASASGEFHVGLNFAGVWKAPCVFVGRSDGSTKTFAARAVGYGIPRLRVDGHDVLAVWQAATEAIDRARSGDGATLIETVTHRVQGELADKHDPLHRLRAYLRQRGLWSERHERELAERCQQQITDALAAAERKHPPATETMFDDVYEQLPWHLREQRAHALGNG